MRGCGSKRFVPARPLRLHLRVSHSRFDMAHTQFNEIIKCNLQCHMAKVMMASVVGGGRLTLRLVRLTGRLTLRLVRLTGRLTLRLVRLTGQRQPSL
jgi:hypothetical protein